ncbi:ribosomal protein L11 methyltransferase [Clostridia bacterium]|nr:ribosomal protein L11 methyltransferase [Clostridia bacterium]
MKYLELTINTTTEASELISYLAQEAGATGVSVIDRQLLDQRGEYAQWDSVDDAFIDSLPDGAVVKATFGIGHRDEMRNARERIEALRGLSDDELGLPLGELTIKEDELDDAAWADNWKQYFKPFKVGRHLVVKPAWEVYAALGDEIVLNLDPGMAFGTGTHETTALCLAWLEEVVRRGDTVLDVGCGSGILAIAAAKLGARDVLACDFDPDAVKVADENIERNNLTGTVVTRVSNLMTGFADDSETARFIGGSDVIAANILADIIIRLLPQAKSALKPGGVIVSSGIIKDRRDDVLSALEDNGFETIGVTQAGEWVAIAARNAENNAGSNTVKQNA